MKCLKSILFFPVVVSLILIVSVHYYVFLRTPVGPARPIKFHIKAGTHSWEICNRLEDDHIVSNAWMFMASALVTRKISRLEAGMYVFEGKHYPMEIMDMLFHGRTVNYIVTIPEGSDVYDIADRLNSDGIISKKEFLDVALSPKTAVFFGIHSPSMEGYLFPDTYYLSPNMTPLEIVAVMAKRFRQVYIPAFDSRAKELGMDQNEVVTLASIIEKEAVVREEKPVISSVFHNRLRLGMLLQSDPTAIYGIDGFNRKISKKDLMRDSRYNTYRYRGLPPGPICNPGKDSIMAALWPAKTDYLYFVARGGGRHYFSVTLKQHLRAVAKVRRNRRR